MMRTWLLGSLALLGACGDESSGGERPLGMEPPAPVAGVSGAVVAGASGGAATGVPPASAAGRAGAIAAGSGGAIAGRGSAAAGAAEGAPVVMPVAGSGTAGGSGAPAGAGAGAAGAIGDGGMATMPDGSTETPPVTSSCKPMPIPEDLRASYGLKAFYTRYSDANGVPVLASDKPSEESIRRACMVVLDLSNNAKIHDAMIQEKIRFVLMAKTEKTVDVPEFTQFGDLDWRARGLGSTQIAVCAEENVMCEQGDRWRGESICYHEYSHTVHLGAAAKADRNFNADLNAAFQASKSKGLWNNTYAGEQAAEYWAEGVQDWFNTNLASRSGMNPDGVHNHVNTRAELQAYDPTLYALVAKWMPEKPGYKDCYYYE